MAEQVWGINQCNFAQSFVTNLYVMLRGFTVCAPWGSLPVPSNLLLLDACTIAFCFCCTPYNPQTPLAGADYPLLNIGVSTLQWITQTTTDNLLYTTLQHPESRTLAKLRDNPGKAKHLVHPNNIISTTVKPLSTLPLSTYLWLNVQVSLGELGRSSQVGCKMEQIWKSAGNGFVLHVNFGLYII